MDYINIFSPLLTLKSFPPLTALTLEHECRPRVLRYASDTSVVCFRLRVISGKCT